EFAEEEVVVQYGEPSRIGSIADAKQDAVLRGMEWTDVDPTLFYAGVALTEPATKRFVRGCGLAGATRVLLERFPDYRTKSAHKNLGAASKPRRKTGPKPELRRSIAERMLAALRSKSLTVEDLKGDTLEALATAYGGSKNTAGQARTDAIAQFSEFRNSEQP